MASTIQGRLTRGHESSSTDVSPADVATPRQHFFLPRILHQCLPQTQHEESTIYSLTFPQTCTAKIADARKVTRVPCKRNIDDRAHRIKIVERFGAVLTADHKVFDDEQESSLHHKYAVVVQDQPTHLIQSEPCKNKSAQEMQRCLGTFLRPEEIPRSIHMDISL